MSDLLKASAATRSFEQQRAPSTNPFTQGTPGVAGPGAVGGPQKPGGAGAGNQFLPEGIAMRGADAWGAEGGSAPKFGGFGPARTLGIG
jgi:hypothetical protein